MPEQILWNVVGLLEPKIVEVEAKIPIRYETMRAKVTTNLRFISR